MQLRPTCTSSCARNAGAHGGHGDVADLALRAGKSQTWREEWGRRRLGAQIGNAADLAERVGTPPTWRAEWERRRPRRCARPLCRRQRARPRLCAKSACAPGQRACQVSMLARSACTPLWGSLLAAHIHGRWCLVWSKTGLPRVDANAHGVAGPAPCGCQRARFCWVCPVWMPTRTVLLGLPLVDANAHATAGAHGGGLLRSALVDCPADAVASGPSALSPAGRTLPCALALFLPSPAAACPPFSPLTAPLSCFETAGFPFYGCASSPVGTFGSPGVVNFGGQPCHLSAAPARPAVGAFERTSPPTSRIGAAHAGLGYEHLMRLRRGRAFACKRAAYKCTAEDRTTLSLCVTLFLIRLSVIPGGLIRRRWPGPHVDPVLYGLQVSPRIFWLRSLRVRRGATRRPRRVRVHQVATAGSGKMRLAAGGQGWLGPGRRLR
eukprot:350230-Chlamydomonas_euryale.AAC.2